MLILSASVAACGLNTPLISEITDRDIPAKPEVHRPKFSATAQIELEIKKKVFCELKRAVMNAKFEVVYKKTLSDPGTVVTTDPIPNDWIAEVSLSLQVDETGALNPGVALNEVLPNAMKVFGVGNSVTTAQSFSLGIGGSLSSTATRIDKFNPQYSVAFLKQPEPPDSVCNEGFDPFERVGLKPARSSQFLVESNLGIEDWLYGAMLVDTHLPSDPCVTAEPLGVVVGTPKPDYCPTPKQTPKPKRRADANEQESWKQSFAQAAGGGGAGAEKPASGTSRPDGVSYEIKFVILSSGNATPTWKLVKLSADTGSSSLLNISRTRTHDLIITIGPNSTATDNHQLASEISAGMRNHPVHSD